MKKLPDGPKTPKLLQQLHWLGDPIGYMEAAARQPYRDIFQAEPVGLGESPLFVSHPQALQQIFTDPKSFTAPGELNKILTPFLGDYSMITLSGSRHRRRRQMVMPSFHNDRMLFYSQLICNHASLALGQLKIGQRFSAYTSMREISRRVILDAIFGLDRGERAELLRQGVKNLSEIFDSPLNYTWMFFPILRKDIGPLSSWGYFCRQRQQVDEIIYAEIRERRSSPDPSRKDILSLLISARDETGQPMSDVELRDQLMHLLTAGTETVTTAMTWGLYWIHHLPEVREKLLAEMDTLEENSD
ncbi:MAG: cytochrome P450, partial [Okeania sp. SIO1H6]|nr:cytochrome P450 [Okeania sp. SIO1H6]